MKNKQKAINVILTILPFVCIIILWAVVAILVNNAKVLPSMVETLKAFVALFSHAEFYLAFFGTLLRAIVAFFCSFIITFLLALTCKQKRNAIKIVQPIIALCRALPTIAVVLLLVIWTNSQIAPVIVTMLVVLPTVFNGVMSAFNTIDNELIETCKVFKVTKKDIFKKVQFPQIFPEMLTVIGSGLSLNIKLMVAAEVIAFTSNSLGHYLLLSNLYDATATMMALVLCTVITGLTIEFIFNAFAKKVGAWK